MVNIRVGNDRPILQHTIKNKQSGDPISLVGATVTPKCFFTVTSTEVDLTNNVVEVDFAKGKLTFKFDVNDFDGSELGRIKFYYHIVFSNGDIFDTMAKYYKVI